MSHTAEERLAEALVLAKEILDKTKKELADAREENRRLTPPAAYAEKVLIAGNLHTVNSIAVHLGVSAIILNKFLEQQKWIYREGKIIYPTAKIRGKGYCDYHIVTYAYDIDGNPKTREHLKWTEAGRQAIIALWNEVHGLLL